MDVKEQTITAPAPLRDRCRRPRCQREAVSRGLCRTCYEMARQLVMEGATTWRALEERGKCEPAQRTCKSWFLE